MRRIKSGGEGGEGNNRQPLVMLRLKEAERSTHYKPKLAIYGSKMNSRAFSSLKKMKISDHREPQTDPPSAKQTKFEVLDLDRPPTHHHPSLTFSKSKKHTAGKKPKTRQKQARVDLIYSNTKTKTLKNIVEKAKSALRILTTPIVVVKAIRRDPQRSDRTSATTTNPRTLTTPPPPKSSRY